MTLIERLEKDKWHVSGVDIQEAINLIESQAVEIAALKTCLERTLIFLGEGLSNQAVSEIRTTLYALYGE